MESPSPEIQLDRARQEIKRLQERIDNNEALIDLEREGISGTIKAVIALVIGMFVSIFVPELDIVVACVVMGYLVWLGVESNRLGNREELILDLKRELSYAEDRLEELETKFAGME